MDADSRSVPYNTRRLKVWIGMGNCSENKDIEKGKEREKEKTEKD